MVHVTVAGHICVDLTPSLPPGATPIPGTLVEIGSIDIRPGGCVYNTGSALAALGIPVTAVATLGDDALGEVLARQMAATGISTAFTIDPDRATPYSIVVESPEQDRAFLHHVGAAAGFTGVAVETHGLDLLHLGYPTILPALIEADGAALVDLFRRAKGDGATTSLDLSVVHSSSPAASKDWSAILDRVLPLTDVFSPSIDDLVSIGAAAGRSPADADSATRDMLARGAGIVMVSAGSHGAAVAAGSPDRLARGGAVLRRLPSQWADTHLWAAPRRVARLATTNGAGDTMTAGLLYALLQAWPPQAAGEFAALIAATRIQGQPLGHALDLFDPGDLQDHVG